MHVQSQIGYPRKNPNGMLSWGHTYFFKKTPEIFRFVILPLEIPGRISKAKNQDQWNDFFLIIPGNSTSYFFTDPWLGFFS